jgi:hypothetical protein
LDASGFVAMYVLVDIYSEDTIMVRWRWTLLQDVVVKLLEAIKLEVVNFGGNHHKDR